MLCQTFVQCFKHIANKHIYIRYSLANTYINKWEQDTLPFRGKKVRDSRYFSQLLMCEEAEVKIVFRFHEQKE